MTCCNQFVINTTRHTTLCLICGLEKLSPFTQFSMTNNQNTYNTHAPLVQVYSRKKRFERLLNSVLQPSPFSGDNKMLEYLATHKPIKDMKSLLALMKKSSSKDKRYSSIHLYTSLFVSDYSKPPTPINLKHIISQMIRCFEDVEFAHRRYFAYGHPFFNYMWIWCIHLI